MEAQLDNTDSTDFQKGAKTLKMSFRCHSEVNMLVKRRILININEIMIYSFMFNLYLIHNVFLVDLYNFNRVRNGSKRLKM